MVEVGIIDVPIDPLTFDTYRIFGIEDV